MSSSYVNELPTQRLTFNPPPRQRQSHDIHPKKRRLSATDSSRDPRSRSNGLKISNERQMPDDYVHSWKMVNDPSLNQPFDTTIGLPASYRTFS